ncbi:hypothetical protein [Parapedobacter soli]|uniref:hypothetical protein n=1 Tax=Parapedobacter soli TaxID=416955 RepID=UPI0021C6DA47|nr:hypothetical protein [Parapedobacter soli]
MEETFTPQNYHDRLPRLWGAAIAALAVAVIGMREQFLVLVVEHTWAVAVVYGLSFALAWFLIRYVGAQTRILDRSHPWLDDVWSRLLHQFFRAVLVPTLIVLLFAVLFYNLFSDTSELKESGYFYSDYPLSFLLLIILSMCYAFAYLIAYVRNLHVEVERLRKLLTIERERTASVEAVEPERNTGTYSLADDEGSHAIPYEDICYFRMCIEENDSGKPVRFIELVCKDGRKFKAKEDSLVQVVQHTEGFFKQVCRRYVVGQHAIAACMKDRESGKLMLTLSPDAVEVELSIRNSSKLKDWILEQVKTISRHGSTDMEAELENLDS